MGGKIRPCIWLFLGSCGILKKKVAEKILKIFGICYTDVMKASSRDGELVKLSNDLVSTISSLLKHPDNVIVLKAVSAGIKMMDVAVRAEEARRVRKGGEVSASVRSIGEVEIKKFEGIEVEDGQ